MKKTASISLPFGTRLLDWWQGTNSRARSETVVEEEIAVDPIDDEDDGSFRWTPPRISLNHRLWGPGFVGPGGSDYTLELVRPAAVDSSQSLLDFNAGLGGPAAVISKFYQMYVDGQETKEILVDEGLRVAKHYHVADRVKILDFTPDDFTLAEKKYYCVLSREFFHLLQNKEEAIEKIYYSLKDLGSLVFTDFVVSEKVTETSPGFSEWRETEPEPVYPWRPSQYRDLLAELGFELRIFGDDSEKYRQMVLNGLQNFVNTLPESPISEEQTEILMKETEIWRGRIKALETDEVKVLRAHAVRKRKLF